MATSAAFSFLRGLGDVGGYFFPTQVVGTPQFVPGRFNAGLYCAGGSGFTIAWPLDAYYFNMGGGRSYTMWVKAEPGAAGQTRVLYDCEKHKIYLATSNGDLGILINGSMFSTGVDVCDGEWHHLIYTHERVDYPNYRALYVDGVQVAKQNNVGDPGFTESGPATAWVGMAAGGAEPANATISDLRILNDPIRNTEPTLFRDTPVRDYSKGLFSFNASENAQFGDASENADHLLQGGASLTPARTGNGFLYSGAQGMWTAPFFPGPMDRLHVSFWFKADSFSGTTDIMTLSTSDGTDRFRLYTDGSGGLASAFVRDNTSVSEPSYGGSVLTTGVWHQVTMQAWGQNARITMDGLPPVEDDGGFSGYPANTPSFSGISRLSIAKGVIVDDLRIVSNWISGPSNTSTMPEAEIVAPLTGARDSTWQPVGVWRKGVDGALARMVIVSFDSSMDTSAPSVPDGLAVVGSPVSTSFTFAWDASVDAGDAPDNTAPSAPANLSEAAVSANSFGLEWEESSDA